MTVRILADTNVVICAIDPRTPEKRARCRAWLSALRKTGSVTISLQVLHEGHAALRRKLRLPPEQAARLLAGWASLCDAPLTVAETERALQIEQRYKVSWWDAVLMASAIGAECTHLLSEDMQSAPLIDGLRILNPFETAPEDVLGG